MGSLIDAHPNAIISHELDVLYFLQLGYSRNQILFLIRMNSLEFSNVGRSWTGYKYEVPSQQQGGYENRLLVIGDKKGGKTTRRLKSNRHLLEKLQEEIELPISLIHIVRNPFDNIATISRKHGMTLEDSIKFYFSLCRTINETKKDIDLNKFLEFKLESLIADPSRIMKRVTNFLGLVPSADYLSSCSSVVFRKPKKTRRTTQWKQEQMEEVLEGISKYEFLKGYEYSEQKT